jgi:serine/threonine protein phosphatase PrpC
MRPRSNWLRLIVAAASLIALFAVLVGCTELTSFLQDVIPPTATGIDVDSTAVAPAATGVTPEMADGASPESSRLIQWLVEEPGMWQLAGLVALGILLAVVTAVIVYLLIRRKPRKRPRTGRPARVSQGVLQKGTQLKGGHYVVVGPLSGAPGSQEAGRPGYEVQATTSLVICPRCYSPAGRQRDGAAPPPQLCATCGALLEHYPSQAATLIAREIGPEQFEAVSEMLARRIVHPALVMPVDAFTTEGPGGTRYYQIEPKILHTLLLNIEMPQPIGRVLAWGQSLARGLNDLHQHQVVLRGSARTTQAVDAVVADDGTGGDVADMVVLDGDEARWLCFNRVAPLVSADERETAPVFQQNVRELRKSLLQVATGGAANGALPKVPDPIKAMITEVLSRDVDTSAANFADLLEQNRRELAYQEQVRLLTGARSDVGRLRKLNEDSMFVRDYSDLFSDLAMTVGVVAVADGVGGNSAGDVASRLTVEALADYGAGLRQTAANGQIPDPVPWVTQAAAAANHAVYRERQAASSDMGCTLVMALFVGSAATLLNVGDSRAYRLRPQGMTQVTVDHSLVQRLIDIGQLTREEARHHPQKSIIYRVMGDTPDLAYDIYEVFLQAGDALLLCSDGLSDMVEDDVLWQVWRAAASPDEACQRLVALANEAGGYDNITVVIAQIV